MATEDDWPLRLIDSPILHEWVEEVSIKVSPRTVVIWPQAFASFVHRFRHEAIEDEVFLDGTGIGDPDELLLYWAFESQGSERIYFESLRRARTGTVNEYHEEELHGDW